MGADTFVNYAAGADDAAAFRAAVEQAQYDYGHAGYTGTIAEKTEYVIIEHKPMLESDAADLAGRLIRKADSRIDDKWGPAGAIPVRADERELTGVPVPARFGGYPDQHAAALAAVAARLTDGETVTRYVISGYQTRADGGIDVDATTAATVTTTGTPDVTGWLFFGWASS